MSFTELPKHWKWVRLGDVSSGVEYGSAAKSKATGQIPVLRMGNIQNGKFDWSDLVYTSDEAEIKKYLLKKNDVLFNRTNSPELVGKTAIFKGERPAIFAGYLIRINRIESLMDADYLAYFLNSHAAKNYGGSVKSFGVNQSNINGTKLKNYPLPLPPLAEQQRIVAKLEALFSELDAGLASLNTAAQQLKTYRQAVLKWAFEGKLTNDHVTEGALPAGWKWLKLGEIAKIIGGVTKGRNFKGKETIFLPYLRVANVQDGYLDLKEIKTIEVLPSDKDKYALVPGDILYTEGGDKDKLGRGTIWKNEVNDCIHQNHIFRARPFTKEIDSKYIAYFSRTNTAKNYFFKNGKQTTNLASINLTILSNLPIPLCSLEEQHRIVQEIESRLSVCDKLEETLAAARKQAEALRQSILKQAFAGKLVAPEESDKLQFVAVSGKVMLAEISTN